MARWTVRRINNGKVVLFALPKFGVCQGREGIGPTGLNTFDAKDFLIDIEKTSSMLKLIMDCSLLFSEHGTYVFVATLSDLH